MDDEVLGCSSFLQMRSPETTVLYGTSQHAFVDGEILANENKKLVEFLGCDSLRLSFEAVNRLDHLPIVEIVNEFEQIIGRVKPNTVLVAYPSYNQDHRTLYEAMLTALRPHDKIYYVKKVLIYEEPETFGTLRKVDSFKATYFRPLDIEFKLQALQFYQSQLRGHRSLDHIRTIARLRGMQGNMEYAEAFEVVRWID